MLHCKVKVGYGLCFNTLNSVNNKMGEAVLRILQIRGIDPPRDEVLAPEE